MNVMCKLCYVTLCIFGLLTDDDVIASLNVNGADFRVEMYFVVSRGLLYIVGLSLLAILLWLPVNSSHGRDHSIGPVGLSFNMRNMNWFYQGK